MSFKAIVFLIFVFASTASARTLNSRIVNGITAAPGEFPYAVSYRYFDRHNCGASIISRSWILTAAHCIHEDFNNVSSILFGTINVENNQIPVNHVSDITKTIQHPLYEPFDGYPNDIGLVELKEVLTYNDFIQPIQLSIGGSPTPVGKVATLVGWGYEMDNGEVLSQLHKVDIFVYSDEACKRIHGKNITTAVHICAGVPEGGKGQCSGDSGGPLAVDGVQIGTVSWSVKPCAIKGYPGVFARVSNYREWINSHTNM
ncbi:hypothetical protein FQR65_LT02023 [Abscondita terminalis]|nr:hypothetical protein FQR65_LT02023 [Abscondita terminalis]